MDYKNTIENIHRLSEAGKFEEALQHLHAIRLEGLGHSEKISVLLDEATCYSRLNQVPRAQACIAEARCLAEGDDEASASADFVASVSLIDQGKREEAVNALSRLLSRYSTLLRKPDERELYEAVQLQLGFTLMFMARREAARPILEEAVSFKISTTEKSRVLCHLGRCYHELAMYQEAKEQFNKAQELGIPEDWESTFHYYFGYTLYELKEFQAAARELVLCLQSGVPGPPSALVYKMLAAIYRKLGDHRQARAYNKMARSL
jgi:tetratricopeptide (TPR) repeat protein